MRVGFAGPASESATGLALACFPALHRAYREPGYPAQSASGCLVLASARPLALESARALALKLARASALKSARALALKSARASALEPAWVSGLASGEARAMAD